MRDLTNRVGALEGLNGTLDTRHLDQHRRERHTDRRERQRRRRRGHVRQQLRRQDGHGARRSDGHLPGPRKQNSYYVAGLAYYANTTDLRTDFANDRGIQNVQTFMIDTQEFNNNPLDGPKNMLWLAGKYGGFIDKDNDDMPQQSEWDADGDGVAGQLRARDSAAEPGERPGPRLRLHRQPPSSASSASVNSGSISDSTRIYQTLLQQYGTWTGQLLAFRINGDGTLGNGLPLARDSEASGTPPRNCPPWTRGRSSRANRLAPKVPFRWASLDAPRQGQ